MGSLTEEPHLQAQGSAAQDSLTRRLPMSLHRWMGGPAVNPQEGRLSSVSSRPVRAGSQRYVFAAPGGGDLEKGVGDLVLRCRVPMVLRQERTFQFPLLG